MLDGALNITTEAKSLTVLSRSDFDVIEFVGQGSYGEVYRAIHHHDGLDVALKCIGKLSLVRQNEVQSMITERQVLLTLKNTPNIVKLYGTFQDMDSVYFVLEYCTLGDLSLLIKTYGRLPISWVRFFTAEIARAIHLVHLAGYVHRDIKASNVLIAHDGHARLSDFGTAIEHSELGSKPTLVGTALYTAPEVLREESQGMPADMWGLGCVIYEMLCGQPPFASPGHQAIFNQILNNEWSFPKDIVDSAPPELLRLIKNLLEPDVSKRMTGPEVLLDPFFGVIAFDKLSK
ncbi:hypothetical protein KIPB_007754 [Kipferlia bialata]|uniref:non-specific serine/threonine protein kinase n=1 Tax=Kipferlia bialata TaxID=797122 RepID=A0A9K3D0P8_9EUKA|nr:hypothetical protein KIPB_007754 [Kipferlia bialata]|eukprot:g7754.t1